jgi:hypothetical protein
VRVVLGLALFLTVGCVGPRAEWDDAVPTIRPLGAINSPQGLLIVRTWAQGGRQAEGDRLHRGFRVTDADGHLVANVRGFDEDWGAVRLFPGRYMVLSFVGDGVFDRHWEKAQVVVAAGQLTAVSFVSPSPRELLP